MASFLSEIVDRLEYEQLIEEGKDPIEILHYKYRHVPTKIIDAVIEIDPTKKKSYSQWLLSHWNDESDTIVNGLKSGRIEKLFQHYKNHSDIQIKDCPSVEEGLRQFVPEEDTVLEKSTNPTTVLMNNGWTKEVPSELANDFDIVFNEDDWVIAVPNTYEADCKLGENMNWCTAGGRSSYENGRSYFDRYLSDYDGKYYVNFDMTQGESRLGKDYPFTRYQFHFESHQFMDKEDDPIEIASIGMPESAKEYYLNEGYDEDSFVDEEGRIERYDNERWNCSFRVNEDLVLNIAYDEQYQFEEPNESTDYYIFSEDDDRDPICWDEVPNPNFDNETIMLNSDSLCIFKSKYGDDGSIIAAIKAHNSGWGRWETYKFSKYTMLPDNVGVFGIDDNKKYRLVTIDSDVSTKIEAKNCEDIFINEYCTKFDSDKWEMIFVESVSNSYHSLFAISIDNNGMGDDCKVIVKGDIPRNGEYFTINENGLVEGELRNYRVYDDDYYGESDSAPQWSLEQKLANGDYIISVDEQNGYGKINTLYNILKPHSNQPLIEDWFDKYMGTSVNLYGVMKDGKLGFFTIREGMQVGRWYDSHRGIDPQKDIISGIIGKYGKSEQTDIINGYIGKVIASFREVISRKAVNNKVVVLDHDGFTSKVFDYTDGKFYFPELSSFMRVSQYDYPYLFCCNIGETEERALFDLSKEQIVARGIQTISRLSRYNDVYLKLTKTDGKLNAFNMNTLSEMFQSDVDAITSINEYIHIIVYELNGRAYPYDYEKNQVMINPNGIPLPTYVTDGDKIYCEGQNYNIYFVLDGKGGFKFYSWQNKTSYGDYGTNFDKEHTPQEVLNMYNLIYGQQESIKDNFRNMMNRINEAMKLSYIDFLD